jgi:thymidylate synthase (FAD)
MTRLISITAPQVEGIRDAEHLVTYCARVSNPKNQHAEPEALIRYLVAHKHWSPFEMVSATVEVVTYRYVAQQLLRHRSFSFQEFSQRYSDVPAVLPHEMRLQATHNRQSSTTVTHDWDDAYADAVDLCVSMYEQMIAAGVARETARAILPQSAKTTMYVTGSLRSWIHYLQVRLGEDTQKEHRLLAASIRATLAPHFPVTFAALDLCPSTQP